MVSSVVVPAMVLMVWIGGGAPSTSAKENSSFRKLQRACKPNLGRCRKSSRCCPGLNCLPVLRLKNKQGHVREEDRCIDPAVSPRPILGKQKFCIDMNDKCDPQAGPAEPECCPGAECMQRTRTTNKRGDQVKEFVCMDPEKATDGVGVCIKRDDKCKPEGPGAKCCGDLKCLPFDRLTNQQGHMKTEYKCGMDDDRKPIFPPGPRGIETCRADNPASPEWNQVTRDLLQVAPEGKLIAESLKFMQDYGGMVGSTTALIAEAADAAASGAPIKDGESGDIDFPYGQLKPIATSGERMVCDGSEGETLVGAPDGVGAYLSDDQTVRVVWQSESYGPLRPTNLQWPFMVNDGAASFDGSHVQYVDYDRRAIADKFMDGDFPASEMVTGSGNMIRKAYNLKGESIGPRSLNGPTEVGAHFGNCDADGNYVIPVLPNNNADWFYQSFCSAHLEEPHQYGPGLGSEDRLYMTNEEWIFYEPNVAHVGISAQVIDIAEKTIYAVGAFTQSGFEKNVELNPQHTDYVVWANSGYNGAWNGDLELLMRNEEYTRSDGMPYVWTNDIHPARIYIGVKGKMEDGSNAPPDDFLARNGLRYGQIYGYAIDMSETGPTAGLWRDEWHRSAELAFNGAMVPGKWVAQPWRWDGVVRNYRHDGAWDYQDPPPGADPGYMYWNAMGINSRGCKCEHHSPDTRPGITGFVQGSTCGYFGHYYVDGLKEMLESMGPGELPTMLDGRYYNYQGERPVNEQIMLGGKGQYVAPGTDATMNYDSAPDGTPKFTFEDIDGLEVIQAKEGQYIIIQEDSDNEYGERMLTAKLEHDDDGQELTYYLVAISGGGLNSRGMVGIPKGTACSPGSHEFSGTFDLSGLVAKDELGRWYLKADDPGFKKRMADATVRYNDKLIIINLQAHNMGCGVIRAFQADRGGQVYLYKPDLPKME